MFADGHEEMEKNDEVPFRRSPSEWLSRGAAVAIRAVGEGDASVGRRVIWHDPPGDHP